MNEALQNLTAFAKSVPQIVEELSSLEKESELLNEKIHAVLSKFDFNHLLRDAESLAGSTEGNKWLETSQLIAFISSFAEPEYKINPEMNPLKELSTALQKLAKDIDTEK